MISNQDGVPAGGFGLGLPVLVLAVGFLAFTSFQTYELVHQRTALSAIDASQAQPLEETNRLQAQVQQLAGDTKALADGGDAAAKAVEQDLGRQRIVLRAPPQGQH